MLFMMKGIVGFPFTHYNIYLTYPEDSVVELSWSYFTTFSPVYAYRCLNSFFNVVSTLSSALVLLDYFHCQLNC